MKDSVLVFRTSVEKTGQIASLSPLLDRLIQQNGRWIFDLEDCDKILKVVNPKLPSKVVIDTLGRRGFWCEELS